MSQLSVILPNYNHGHLLQTACKAIFSQSLLPQEVIIIDDGSTDHSIETIRELQKNHPNIQLIQNKENLGPIPTINKGIEKAKGKYLAFCSADDYILPGFFEKALTLFKENPTLGICTGRATHFKGNTPDQLTIEQPPLPDKVHIFNPKELAKVFKKSLFFIHSNCSIYRKKYIEEFGGLNPKLLSISDWYITCQIALHYGVGYIPHPFGAFRLSPTSYAQSLKNSPTKETMFQNLMDEIKSEGEEWTKTIKNSGLLAQAGAHMVLFILKHPHYWPFFPKAFLKKCQFYYLGKKFTKKK